MGHRTHRRIREGERLDVEILAVPVALGAAVCFGGCSVLQHEGTRRVHVRDPLAPALLPRLLRQPIWLLGGLFNLAGVGLQAAALRLGSVSVVQPLIVMGLLVAVPLAARFARRRLHAGEVSGALLVVAGVGLFLLMSRPGAGVGSADNVPALPAAAAGLAVVTAAAGCVAASRSGRSWSGLVLALAAGLLLGSSTVPLKLTTEGADRFRPRGPARMGAVRDGRARRGRAGVDPVGLPARTGRPRGRRTHPSPSHSSLPRSGSVCSGNRCTAVRSTSPASRSASPSPPPGWCC